MGVQRHRDSTEAAAVQDRAELLDVGEKLLRLRLMDGSETEQRLLHVWLSSLRNPGGPAS